MVQKHAATRLHYDFRLEVAGVFRSWAVPKGPSMNPRERRLAVPVEDHTLGWGNVEGVIAEGEYGEGAVIVWDRGAYRCLSEPGGEPASMEESLERGLAIFGLDGEKLRGVFRLRRVGDGRDVRWLLTKLRDAEAEWEGDILVERPESVLTRRTIEEVARGAR